MPGEVSYFHPETDYASPWDVTDEENNEMNEWEKEQMSFDPFSDEPQDESPDEGIQLPSDDQMKSVKRTTTRKTPAKKETNTVAADNTNTGLTLTFKGGSGFDAPWIVLHAADLAAADDFLAEENRDLLKSVMERTQQAGSFFVSKAPGGSSGGAARPAAGGNPRQAPAGAEAAPGGEARVCKHGDMTYKSGVSAKTGKAWKAFMCPSPKGTPDQCEAQWLR